jgi:hypothetical protein
MSWIRKHWDDEYIGKAEKIVKDTVSAKVQIPSP